MPMSKEARREYDRERRQRPEYKKAERARWNSPANNRRKPPKPFVGVDGEGGNIAGRHEYLLLRVGTHLLYKDSRPLRTREILSWLTALPREGIYIGYGFDYDVTMILRDWTPEALRELFDRDGRKTKNGRYSPVLHAGFYVEYLPRKHFKVAAWTPVYADLEWFTIHDVIGFYQSSFVQALDAWNIGSESERETIREMKLKRADFTEATDDEIEYNRRECVMLAELVEALRAAVNDAGYSIRNYEGAGCLAQAMLTKHNAPKRQDLEPAIIKAARHAYYGGRFEISRIGNVEPVHEYDLASAYPWAMTGLPCLQHGEWVNEYQPGNPVQLLKVRWATDPERAWGPYPFRDPSGAILYPSSGTGWYWYPEVYVEDRANETNDVLDAWTFVRHCEHMPFNWIPSVYAERQRMGKAARGKVLKLGLNSLYGKQAQSVGSPRFASPIYAGLITSKVRALMAEVCLRYGDQVVMIATDGIYLTTEMQSNREMVQAGERAPLGCWEHQRFDDLFLVKPGIYFTSNGVKVKTRGVPRWQLDEQRDALIAAWDSDGLDGFVTINRTQFIGARMALHQQRPERIGQWVPTSVQLRYDSNTVKRDFDNAGVSRLWERAGLTSTPYAKHFGQEIQNEMLWEDLDVLEQW